MQKKKKKKVHLQSLEREIRQKQACLRAKKKKYRIFFLVPWPLGPRYIEPRFDLKRVVRGSPKDMPMEVKRYMTVPKDASERRSNLERASGIPGSQRRTEQRRLRLPVHCHTRTGPRAPSPRETQLPGGTSRKVRRRRLCMRNDAAHPEE